MLMTALGCGSIHPLAPTPDDIVVYDQSFADGPAGWLTYLTQIEDGQVPAGAFGCWQSWHGKLACMTHLEWTEGRVVSRSPWWLDPNHAPPGAGYLMLVGFVYLGSLHDGLPDPFLDLRNARLTVRVRADDLELGGASLVFWVQAKVSSGDGKVANFALTGQPIDPGLRDRHWVDVNLDLRTDPIQWTCLGASEARLTFYGCASIEDVLANVDLDFGFILLPVDITHSPSGVVMIDHVRIVRSPGLPRFR